MAQADGLSLLGLQAVVTGAAGGIGGAITRQLTAQGAKVHALDRDASALRVLAEGMRPDPDRMRANLAITNGLVMAERVMMALADHLGRAEAHHLVQAACLAAMAEDRPLRDILGDTAEVAARLDPATLDRLMDPAGYLGESAAVVDRVVAAARALPA